MVELFQSTKQNVSLHINNIFKEGELDENSVVKEYLTVQQKGSSIGCVSCLLKRSSRTSRL